MGVARGCDAWRCRNAPHRRDTCTCARVARALRLFCAAVRRPFSRRTQWELTPNALTRALADRRAASGAVVDLTITNPTAVGLRYPGSFYASLYEGPLAASLAVYEPEPFGLASARQALAGYYRARGCACDASDLWLTSSTSEAFAQLLALLCDPGDAVLVPEPAYPLLEYLAGLADVRRVPYPLRYDGAWFVDRDALARRAAGGAPRPGGGLHLARKSRRARTSGRASSPSSRACAPSAVSRWSSTRCSRSSRCARRPGAAAARSARARASASCCRGSRSSRRCRSCKLAWGVMGGPEALVSAARERLAVIADTSLSVATPVQHALPAILRESVAMRDRIRERTVANLSALARGARVRHRERARRRGRLVGDRAPAATRGARRRGLGARAARARRVRSSTRGRSTTCRAVTSWCRCSAPSTSSRAAPPRSRARSRRAQPWHRLRAWHSGVASARVGRRPRRASRRASGSCARPCAASGRAATAEPATTRSPRLRASPAPRSITTSTPRPSSTLRCTTTGSRPCCAPTATRSRGTSTVSTSCARWSRRASSSTARTPGWRSSWPSRRSSCSAIPSWPRGCASRANRFARCSGTCSSAASLRGELAPGLAVDAVVDLLTATSFGLHCFFGPLEKPAATSGGSARVPGAAARLAAASGVIRSFY